MSLAELEATGRTGSDEVNALRKQLADLAAAKAITDRDCDALRAQGHKDADDIAGLKRALADAERAKAASDNKIGVLEIQVRAYSWHIACILVYVY